MLRDPSYYFMQALEALLLLRENVFSYKMSKLDPYPIATILSQIYF